MFDKIKPALVLMTICLVVAAALIVTYNLTNVDNEGVLTEELENACIEVLGEGEYSIVDTKIEGISKVIKAESGNGIVIEVVASGYVKDGLDIVVGMNMDGEIEGVSVVNNAETPGLGTKVEEDSFISQFKGKSQKLSGVASASGDDEIEIISGATSSSDGMIDGVNAAIEAFDKAKEAANE